MCRDLASVRRATERRQNGSNNAWQDARTCIDLQASRLHLSFDGPPKTTSRFLPARHLNRPSDSAYGLLIEHSVQRLSTEHLERFTTWLGPSRQSQEFPNAPHQFEAFAGRLEFGGRDSLAPPANVVETAALLFITRAVEKSDMIAVLAEDVAHYYAEHGLVETLPLAMECRMDDFSLITQRTVAKHGHRIFPRGFDPSSPPSDTWQQSD